MALEELDFFFLEWLLGDVCFFLFLDANKEFEDARLERTGGLGWGWGWAPVPMLVPVPVVGAVVGAALTTGWGGDGGGVLVSLWETSGCIGGFCVGVGRCSGEGGEGTSEASSAKLASSCGASVLSVASSSSYGKCFWA